MASITPRTFTPVRYDLAEIEHNEPINSLSIAEKVAAVFTNRIPKNDPDFFIKSCKYYDTILSQAVKNSDFEKAVCERYVLHLADLHRFDEAYQFCLTWLEKKPDEELAKKYLFDIAITNDDLDEAKKYVSEEIDKDAPFETWVRFLTYHSVNGTIHEVPNFAPFPNDIKAQILFASLLDNYRLVYRLFKDNPDLNYGFFKWIHFIACSIQANAYEVNSAFEDILKDIPPFINFHHFERVVEQLMKRIQKDEAKFSLASNLFLKRPFCITAKRMLAILSPESNKEFLSDLKKLSDLYGSVHLKCIAIQCGPFSAAGKAKILSLILEKKPHFYLVRDIADYNELINKKLKAETYRPYASLRPLFRHCFVTALYNATDLNNPEEVEKTLQEIDIAIKETPNFIRLHRYRLYLLKSLKRFSDAADSIALLTKSMQYHKDCGMALLDFYQAADLPKKRIEIRSSLLKEFPSKTLYDELNNQLLEHGTTEEHIHFLIENYNYDLTCKDLENKIKEVKDCSPYLDAFKNQPRLSPSFVKLRLTFYNQFELYELALDDCIWLSDSEPSALRSKCYLLAQLKRYVESAEVYLDSHFELDDMAFNGLIFHLYHLQFFELLCKVFEKHKSPCFKTRLLAAHAYMFFRNFDKAIALAKQLKKESPGNEEVLFVLAEAYFNKGGVYGTVIDICQEAFMLPSLINRSHFEEILGNAKKALEQKPSEKPALNVSKASAPKIKPIDPSKVTCLIEEPKTKKKEKIEKVKEDKREKHLQGAPAQAVNPLADPLSRVKAIARKGETQTGPKPAAISVPLPVAAAPKSEPPKPIVKVTLKAEEKVFIQKGIVALKDALDMKEALLSQDVVFRNYIYAILRVFTPLRINTTHPTLKNDLKRIRDHARHESDQIVMERLTALFTYLRSISLVHQMQEWMREKSIIHRLMLNNHFITARRPKKTALEKVIKELEFIIKERGEKASWEARLYHRNAIKASLSIIGEASNFLSDELKASFSGYREAGNKIAHEFFEDGDTVSYLEKYKEEDISPDDLWELTEESEKLLKKLKVS